MPKIYYCPVCIKETLSIARYPNYICRDCKNRVSDESGRLVQFSNQTPFGDDFIGRYADTLEVYNSNSCWVDGIKCVVKAARFGGIVILTENYVDIVEPDKILVLLNDKIVEEMNLAETYAQYEKLLSRKNNPEKSLIALLNAKSSYHVYKLKSEHENPPKPISCPECDGTALSSIGRKGGVEAFHAPKFFQCKDCQTKIPEVMITWMRSHTNSEAKEKWNRLYKPELDAAKKEKQEKIEKTRREKLKEVKDLEFVDEQGRPVDRSKMDFDDLEFSDEWGREVDYKGELLEPTLTEEEAIAVAEKMLTSNEIHLLISHCEIYLNEDFYPKSARLFFLLGYGYANTDKILKAREAFLKSILNNLPKIDSVVFGNYITTCFHLEDTKSGLEMVEKYFEDLDFNGKKIVLESFHEAIRVKQVTAEDISSKLKKILKLK